MAPFKHERSQPLRLSVVVPFHRDLNQLRQCLTALRAAACALPAGVELADLIVVADGAVDDPAGPARDADARVVAIEGPRGPAVARNEGAAAASGDVLVFVDSDIVVGRQALARLAALFAADPEVGAAFGAYDEEPADPGFFSQCRNLAHSCIHQRSNRDARTFWAGLGAVRRAVFRAVEGFDPRFARPSVEDIDLGYRIRAAGFRIVLEPAIQGKHLKRWTLWSGLVADVRDRGVPWTQLTKRYGGLHNDLNLTVKYRVSVVAAYVLALSLGAALWWPVFLVLAPVLLATLWSLDRPYYRFLTSRRGVNFAVGWFPFHILHHLCNGLSFAVGTGLYVTRRWIGVALPGTLPLMPWPAATAATAPADVGTYSSTGARDIRLTELVWVSTGFTVVTGLFMAPLLGAITTALPANPGDARLNAWALAWGADRLPHGLRGFWSPPIFHPYEHTLAYSENLLGVAVLVAPVQWRFGNPTLTYNVALLLSFVVAAVGAYVLGRELTGRRDAALVGACAFAFAPYRWAQLSHLQVLSVGWLPLVLWALHRAVRSPSWPPVLVFVAAVLLQMFSNGYAAFQTALAIGVVMCWSVARQGLPWVTLRWIAGAAAVVGLLLAPAIVAHSHVWAGRDLIAPGDLVRYGADLGTYLDVAPDLPGARWLPGVPQDEGHLFPGVVVLLMTAVALAPIARPSAAREWRWLYVVMAVLAIVISLGPEPQAWERPLPIPGVYMWLHSAVPLFHALRVPARFGMLAVLAFAMLAALGAACLASGRRRTGAAAIAVALCGGILWEGYGGPLVVVPSGISSGNRWDAVANAWLARQPSGVVLDLPLSTLGRASVDHQFAALEHRHPIVSGVSRLETPLQSFLGGSASPLYEAARLPEAVPFLRALEIRYILMRPHDFFEADVAERLAETFGRSTGIRQVARFGDTVAYEIPPAAEGATETADRRRLSPAAVRLSASDQPERLAMATDEDPDTRWMSGRPQDGTEWIALEFDRPRDIARIDLMMGERSVQDYPRDVEIMATDSERGEVERILYRGAILETLGRGWLQSPERPVASIDLPSHRTTSLVIRQLGQTERWYWSVDELIVWERP